MKAGHNATELATYRGYGSPDAARVDYVKNQNRLGLRRLSVAPTIVAKNGPGALGLFVGKPMNHQFIVRIARRDRHRCRKIVQLPHRIGDSTMAQNITILHEFIRHD